MTKRQLRKLAKERGVQLTKHHRCPKSLFGSDSKENISFVTHKKHRAFHALFINPDGTCMNVEQIVHELNTYWTDPAYEIFYKPR